MAGAYVAVAEVARPHGVRGELRLKVYNTDSDLLSRRGGPGSVRLRFPDGSERDVALLQARESNKAVLVRLAGVDDRDTAEALRGAQVCVPRDAVPALAEGEFYACDLEGARAVLGSGGSGEEIGRVQGIVSYPTCDALVVDRGGGRTIEIPLLDAYVASVDVAGKVVQIVTIEGLG
jgi:16S rRNA processing protein RimM